MYDTTISPRGVCPLDSDQIPNMNALILYSHKITICNLTDMDECTFLKNDPDHDYSYVPIIIINHEYIVSFLLGPTNLRHCATHYRI